MQEIEWELLKLLKTWTYDSNSDSFPVGSIAFGFFLNENVCSGGKIEGIFKIGGRCLKNFNIGAVVSANGRLSNYVSLYYYEVQLKLVNSKSRGPEEILRVIRSSSQTSVLYDTFYEH